MPDPNPHGGGIGPGGWGRLIGGLINPYGGMMPYGGGYPSPYPSPYVQPYPYYPPQPQPIYVPVPTPVPQPMPVPAGMLQGLPERRHPDINAAIAAAVADGRISEAQAQTVQDFVANAKATGTFNWQNLIAFILPILSAIFPQIGGLAGIIQIIEALFGGVTPVPFPIPGPTPLPTTTLPPL